MFILGLVIGLAVGLWLGYLTGCGRGFKEATATAWMKVELERQWGKAWRE